MAIQQSQQIYNILDFLGYTAIVVMVDQTTALKWDKIDSPEDIYLLAFENLLERVQMALQNLDPADDDLGVVFVNERDDKTPATLRKRHYALKEDGTDYVVLENIVGVTAPLQDDRSNAMMLADWIVGATRQHCLNDHSAYYEEIFENINRHRDTDEIVGSGVKVVPDNSIHKMNCRLDEI